MLSTAHSYTKLTIVEWPQEETYTEFKHYRMKSQSTDTISFTPAINVRPVLHQFLRNSQLLDDVTRRSSILNFIRNGQNNIEIELRVNLCKKAK